MVLPLRACTLPGAGSGAKPGGGGRGGGAWAQGPGHGQVLHNSIPSMAQRTPLPLICTPSLTGPPSPARPCREKRLRVGSAALQSAVPEPQGWSQGGECSRPAGQSPPWTPARLSLSLAPRLRRSFSSQPQRRQGPGSVSCPRPSWALLECSRGLGTVDSGTDRWEEVGSAAPVHCFSAFRPGWGRRRSPAARPALQTPSRAWQPTVRQLTASCHCGRAWEGPEPSCQV